MENVHEDRNDQNLSENPAGSSLQNDGLSAELKSLQASYEHLRSRSLSMEDNIILLRQEKEEALQKNLDILEAIKVITVEKDSLQDSLHNVEAEAREREEELMKQRDEDCREKVDLINEVGILKEQLSELLEERSRKLTVFTEVSDSAKSVKECLVRILERIDDEKVENFEEDSQQIANGLNCDEESRRLLFEVRVVSELVRKAESRLLENEEMRKKEKKELENSVVSLTEENRDISSLLRVALVEKEAVEKSLSRLKGSSEHKRVAILQIAERGLQKVGFGFMMGNPTGDSSDNLSSNSSMKSDGSDCEEDVVSLASTVEKIMKNLRLEITELKRSLEESRSDSERLQSLTEKQAQKLAESTLYIKDLEERESMLTQNVEELMMAIADAQEEVARWKEACELEVEAGRSAIEERDKEIAVLREELVKTEASLDLLRNKLKLKEELAAAAMAAQAAAERSLQLADSRSAGLRERIEELTRQLEEADSRSEWSNRRRVRHVCWPWRALRINPAASRGRNVTRRMLPEMEALLHFSV